MEAERCGLGAAHLLSRERKPRLLAGDTWRGLGGGDLSRGLGGGDLSRGLGERVYES